jgi:hypothetical protein
MNIPKDLSEVIVGRIDNAMAKWKRTKKIKKIVNTILHKKTTDWATRSPT